MTRSGVAARIYLVAKTNNMRSKEVKSIDRAKRTANEFSKAAVSDVGDMCCTRKTAFEREEWEGEER